MNILVNEKKIIKSKEIICPKCNESIKIYIEDYNIFLNEWHEIDNILFDEFEQTQKIDISKIKCD